MRTIAKLFGKSPFSPLQMHMEKVSLCLSKLGEIFNAFFKNDYAQIAVIVESLSKLEHEADLTKNDIRNHLPRSLFMPIERDQFLELLAIQDALADKSEEIGNLFTLIQLPLLSSIQKTLSSLVKKNFEAFEDAHQIINEIDELLETSFGGVEAEKVKTMVEKTACKEYESTVLKLKTLKEFFNSADALPHSSFYLWLRLIEEVGEISRLSERLANRIRMVLELK